MGYPYAEASWDAATAGMYMGYGGSMPMVFTLISIAVCVAALWKGNSSEHRLYGGYK